MLAATSESRLETHRTAGRSRSRSSPIKIATFSDSITDRHKSVVREILQELFDRDEIYKDEYEGMYCVPCERFFTEKDLVEGNCPECQRTDVREGWD